MGLLLKNIYISNIYLSIQWTVLTLAKKTPISLKNEKKEGKGMRKGREWGRETGKEEKEHYGKLLYCADNECNLAG